MSHIGTHKTPVIYVDSSVKRGHADGFDCSDCACSVSPVTGTDSKYDNSTKAYTLLDEPFSFKMEIDEEFSLFYGIHHAPVVLNSSAQRLLTRSGKNIDLGSEKFSKIEKDALNEMVRVGLLKPIGYLPTLHQHIDTLSTWVHVTDRCNLRCTYCYLPHRRDDMSWEIGFSIIEKIVKTATSNQLEYIRLKYGGGEPLLRFDLIKKMHTYAKSLLSKGSIILSGVVLSNGTLFNKDTATDFLALGLNIMISLDGRDILHDVHRSYAHGGGTHADAKNAISLAKEMGIQITVSVTITDKNVIDLPRLVSWLLDQRLRFTLNFYRSTSLASEELPFSTDTIITNMLEAYRIIENNLPDECLLDTIVDRANLKSPHLHTCGVGQNYLVFDTYGRLSKCQMHLYSGPENKRTSFPLEWARTSKEGVQNLSIEDKVDCASCQWKYWCTGGCALLTYKNTGRYDVRSPNCGIYQSLFPAAMRLEGLRLIKINQQASNNPITPHN